MCVVCSEHHSSCLEFHHIDPTHKDMNISTSLNDVGVETLTAELMKCVVVCANCHRKIHDGVIDISHTKGLTREEIQFNA